MQADTVFVVLVHRSAESIFGAASNPVIRNGKLLCFEDEKEALFERDRLNGRTGSSHMRYSVRPIHVKPSLLNRIANGASAEALRAAPSFNEPYVAPRAA